MQEESALALRKAGYPLPDGQASAGLLQAAADGQLGKAGNTGAQTLSAELEFFLRADTVDSVWDPREQEI